MKMSKNDVRVIVDKIVGDPTFFTREQLQEQYSEDPWLFNQFLNAWEFANGCAVLESYPLDVSLPFVHHCNASCTFCSYWPGNKNSMRSSEIDQYGKLIAMATDVGLNPDGEPLVHEDLENALRLIKNNMDPRAYLYLVTNGYYLDRHFELVVKYMNVVTVSLNAASDEVHREVMGLPAGSFKSIINSFCKLKEYRDRTAIRMKLFFTFVVVRNNLHQLPAFIRICEELQPDRVYIRNLALPFSTSQMRSYNKTEYELLDPGKHPAYDHLQRETVKALASTKVEYEIEPDNWKVDAIYDETRYAIQPDRSISGRPMDGHEHFSDRQRRLCRYPYRYFMDQRQSDIVPLCCYLEHIPGIPGTQVSPGRIQQDFFSIWNSAPYRHLRKALYSGEDLPFTCRDCNILSDFRNPKTGKIK